MSTDDPTFPNVKCETDGTVAPGYAVCLHVAHEGARIAHYHEATDRSLGSVLCEHCSNAVDNLTANDLILMCSRCVDRLTAEAAPIP